jgi:hypothetical protein
VREAYDKVANLWWEENGISFFLEKNEMRVMNFDKWLAEQGGIMQNGFIVFENDNDYTIFMLRWS